MRLFDRHTTHLNPLRLAMGLTLATGLMACSDPAPAPTAAAPAAPAPATVEPAPAPPAPTAIGEGVAETGIDLSSVMTGFSADASAMLPPEPSQQTDPEAQAGQPDPALGAVDPQSVPETPAVAAAAADADLAADSPLRAQVLLERAFFSPGEIDGAVGSNQARALTAYQKAQEMDATGKLDTATWEKLNADTAPILVEYTLTQTDIDGPFRDIPADTMAKAQLDALPYSSVEEALGEKFHASPGLIKKLNPDADMATAGTTLTVPNTLSGGLLPTPDKVVVSKSLSALQLLDASGRVVGQFPVTTGSAQFPLPIGEWKINGVARDPVWHFNPKLIAGSKKTDKKAEIPAGPNNPVGTTWIDLSKEHYGIHGSPEPSRIGKSESNGCIRMTNWTVQALAKVVKPGMVALLQE